MVADITEEELILLLKELKENQVVSIYFGEVADENGR